MGAWIETHCVAKELAYVRVAPLVGAWIETYHQFSLRQMLPSHPSWVRGLKLRLNNIFIVCFVAPLVGAWIETEEESPVPTGTARRTPRGCVD